MTLEAAAAELSALLQQTQEQFRFFQELGVGGVEPLPLVQKTKQPGESLEQIWSEL